MTAHEPSLLRPALLCLGILAHAAAATAAELDTYRQTYAKQQQDIESRYASDTNALAAGYRAALQSLLAKVKAAGDLDRVKAVMAELDSAAMGETEPENAAAMPAIVTLRTRRADRLAEIRRKRASQIVELASSYDKALGNLQVNLVKADRLDDATAVQEERTRALGDRSYLDARELVARKPVAVARPAPPPPEPAVTSRSLPPDLRKGLLVRYAFDNARDELEDSSGNGRKGSGPRAHFSQKGRFGRALECDGAESFAVLGDGGLGDLAQATVCAWVRPDAAQDAPILEFSANNFRYGPHIWSKPDGRLYVNFWGRPGNDRLVLTRPGLLNKGEWTHVALVHDGQRGTVYADGKEVGDEAWDGFRLETRYPFHIGARQGWSAGNVVFDGSIDEVMVFDRALSAREIQQLVRMAL
jgi:hypothetical protein